MERIDTIERINGMNRMSTERTVSSSKLCKKHFLN